MLKSAIYIPIAELLQKLNRKIIDGAGNGKNFKFVSWINWR